MEAKGTALVRKNFKYTTIWPNPQLTLSGVIDLEKDYKESLAGHVVTVFDISCDDKEYLVLGHSKSLGDFIWSIDKRDVRLFLPIIKKYGEVIPAGMSAIEELKYLMKLNLKR